MKEPDYGSLKRCPKCGGLPYKSVFIDKEWICIENEKVARVKCYDCGLKTNWEYGGININAVDHAIQMWNEIPEEHQITQMALFSENRL